MTSKKQKRKEQQAAAVQMMEDVQQGRKPPISLLDAMYLDAPPAIRSFLDHHIMKIVAIEIPKLKYCQENGITLNIADDEYVSVEQVFETTMKYAEKRAPEMFKQITATVRHGGGEIAKAIDTAIRRTTLDAKVINREAYMDILSNHASMLAAIKALTEVPEGSNPSEIDPATK